MNSKLMHAIVSLVVFGGLSAAFVGLTWQPQAHAGTAADLPSAEQAEHEDESEAAGQEPARPLSLAELRRTPCEHGIPIIDCDECRYEAGVAKISPQIAQGLVEAWPVRTDARATKRLILTGEVQLDQTRVAEIASAGAGRVENIRKNLGDRVEAGDMVALVQSSEFGEAQAGFLEARARLDLARQTFDREKQLYERKISSEADYLSARTERASAEALVAAARKRLQLFGLGDDRIEEFVTADSDVSFGQLVLTSPIAGTVIEQNIVRGQIVDTRDMLYRIADFSRVWVWCDLYESDLGPLQERMASGAAVRAEIHAGAFPQTTFRGTIDMIGSQVDHQTRTLKVRVMVDNPDGRLRPGMFVKAAVELESRSTALRIPETAVLSDAGRSFVFVKMTDDLWGRRDVTVGPVENGLVEVHAGLQDGEVIATRGAFLFKSEVLKAKMGAGCAE